MCRSRQSLKIALIEPPAFSGGATSMTAESFCPPLGMIVLGSYLKAKLPKIKLDILDGQLLELDEILQKLEKIKPAVVGINSYHNNYGNVIRIAEFAKSLNSRVLIGGHFATGFAKNILFNRGPFSCHYCIDGVIQRDGEVGFYEYVSGYPLASIKNLIRQEADGIKINPVELPALDSLDHINYDLININDYFSTYQRRFPFSSYKRIIPIYSRRGCRWRDLSGGCFFCARMDMGLRLISPQKYFEKIAGLTEKYSPDLIWDVSDDFLSDSAWFEKFHYIYKSFLPKPVLRIYARPNEINEKIIQKLDELNIKEVSCGFESGDDLILKIMRKGTSVHINEEVIKNFKKSSVRVIGSLVLGSLHENKKSLANTLIFAEQLVDCGVEKIIVNIMSPLPGSQAWSSFTEKFSNYKTKDIYNKNEIVKLWVENFCDVSFEELLFAQKKIHDLSKL